MIPADMTLRGLVDEAKAQLELRGVDSPALSAEILAAHTLGMRRLDIMVHGDRPLTFEQVAKVREIVARRAAGEPVAYLLGEKEFFGLDFNVSPAVLVPRPETELIVEDVQSLFEVSQAFTFADLGTGSGCLAVTIATLFPNAKALAVDMSEAAIEVARSNAVRHGVADRVMFLRADFGLPFVQDSSLDLVVSNPPYVSSKEYAELSPEVASYEPVTALVPQTEAGHSDGLESVRALTPHVGRALRSGGAFLMEFGWKQGDAVRSIVSLPESGFEDVEIRRDLEQRDRYVFARKR